MSWTLRSHKNHVSDLLLFVRLLINLNIKFKAQRVVRPRLAGRHTVYTAGNSRFPALFKRSATQPVPVLSRAFAGTTPRSTSHQATVPNLIPYESSSVRSSSPIPADNSAPSIPPTHSVAPRSPTPAPSPLPNSSPIATATVLDESDRDSITALELATSSFVLEDTASLTDQADSDVEILGANTGGSSARPVRTTRTVFLTDNDLTLGLELPSDGHNPFSGSYDISN
jgi:hypothetical protein